VRKEAPKIQPIAVGLFPGALDFGKLSFVEKTVLKAKGASEGDYRDWPSVKTWASTFATSFYTNSGRPETE
jgi:menaquinone-dependent protoporphyrinogen oxidase